MKGKIFLSVVFIMCISILPSCELPKNNPKENFPSEYNDVMNQFEIFLESNPYDVTLQKDMDEGILSTKEMYDKYVQEWIEEAMFTLENAKLVFGDGEQYDIWKSKKEAWLNTTLDLMDNESDLFPAKLPSSETIIRAALLIRQSVLDTKYFCFLMELEKGVTDQFVSLKWKDGK